MLSALIIAAIALSVAIGYKTKFNTGFFAIVFAYLIGCFAMGMKTKEVIAGWPVSTMFVIFSVSLFRENGPVSSLCLPEISGASSLCSVSGERGDRGPGCRIFYSDGIYGSYYHSDL